MSYHHGNLREALLERAAQVIAEQGIDIAFFRCSIAGRVRVEVAVWTFFHAPRKVYV